MPIGLKTDGENCVVEIQAPSKFAINQIWILLDLNRLCKEENNVQEEWSNDDMIAKLIGPTGHGEQP